MSEFRSGDICTLSNIIDDSGFSKEMKKNLKHLKSLAKTGVAYFLVLDSSNEKKIVVACMYREKRKKCKHYELDGQLVYIYCSDFEEVYKEFLESTGTYFDNRADVVTAIHAYHFKLKKKKRENEEVKLILKQSQARGKSNEKNYPYGYGIAKRYAPSENIRILPGGGMNPR